MLVVIRKIVQENIWMIQGLGFDATEETLIRLVDAGLVQLVLNEEQNLISLSCYDFNTNTYIYK